MVDTRRLEFVAIATPDRKTAAVELGLVVGTGALHLVAENVFEAKTHFIAAAAVFWVGFVVRRVWQDRGWLRAWGFRLDNLRSATWPCAIVLVVGTAALFGYGYALGRLPLPGHFYVLTAIYPLWGLVQQFLLQSLLVRNLRAFLSSPVLRIATAAALFGLSHVPDGPLVGLTIIAGVCWAVLYEWHPNLYPLAVCHGWLGALAYFLVLGRDPWVELFGH